LLPSVLDRATRRLPEDIAHYEKLVVSLREAVRLMGEVPKGDAMDAAIDVHGGCHHSPSTFRKILIIFAIHSFK